jgi:hypothetical protein
MSSLTIFIMASAARLALARSWDGNQVMRLSTDPADNAKPEFG